MAVLFTLPQLEATEREVRRAVPPTPQYAWPLLARRTGCDVWVKHENHSPIGAFKVRGGIVYLNNLLRQKSGLRGVVTATRGNHGQSIARAASQLGLRCIIVAPEGNSPEKNAAMSAFGGDLIIAGRDFDESRSVAATLAQDQGLEMVPSFHADLARGVATYALEFFRAVPDLHTVYVPIGMGSGICGLIGARDCLNLRTRIVGVVAQEAPAMANSFKAGEILPAQSARTFADGMACREPHPEAFDIIRRGTERIVTVSEADIAEAICALYRDTHNIAEGAGAAALAALLKEKEAMRGARVGIILSGGNIDTDIIAGILAGKGPPIL